MTNRFDSSSLFGILSGSVNIAAANRDDGHLPLSQHQQSDGDPALYRPGGLLPGEVDLPIRGLAFCCPLYSRVDIWTHGLTGAEQLDSISAEELLLPAEVVPPGGGLAQENSGTSA